MQSTWASYHQYCSHQADKYKTFWMHPRSKQWDTLDYVIVKRKDLDNVKLTKSVRGADCWSDHRLVKSKMSLRINPKIHRRRTPSQRKLNTLLLNDVSIQEKLSTKIENANLPVETDDLDIETSWKQFKDTIYSTTADILRFC